jgi:hypothetical protein
MVVNLQLSDSTFLKVTTPHLQEWVQVFHGVVHEGALLHTLLCSLQRYYPNIII